MINKIIIAVFASTLFLFSGPVLSNPSQINQGYTEVVSGKYYMTPRDAWLKSINPLKHAQVFWFIEANGLGGMSEAPVNAPIKSPKDWGTLRESALNALISLNLLPKRHSHSSQPREFYFPKEWNRSLQQQTSFRTKKSYTKYCKAKLTIRALKHSSAIGGDLKWWEEIVIPLPDGTNCR